MGIDFLHSILQIAIFWKKAVTVLPKRAFFNKNNTFSFRNYKKRFLTRLWEATHHFITFYTAKFTLETSEATKVSTNPRFKILCTFEHFLVIFPIWIEHSLFRTYYPA